MCATFSFPSDILLTKSQIYITILYLLIFILIYSIYIFYESCWRNPRLKIFITNNCFVGMGKWQIKNLEPCTISMPCNCLLGRGANNYYDYIFICQLFPHLIIDKSKSKNTKHPIVSVSLWEFSVRVLLIYSVLNIFGFLD